MDRQYETGVKNTSIADNQKTVDLLTRKVAALRLSISTRTLDRMASGGLIERVYVGGSVRFRARDIEAIVENGV